MSWPLSQDYNEAVQDPSNFGDAELRAGEVHCNALGLPLPASGNFADVYRVDCPKGRSWALKCFTREMPGLEERYAAIDKHLAGSRLPFTVRFRFLPKGIRVRGNWYPALKMQWVEGLTLNAFVREYRTRPGPLEALAKIWVRMAARLRDAELAHSDLQHGNVLLVQGHQEKSLGVRLIDYDGMWVPALRQIPSGETGHPAYQHPERATPTGYGPDTDRFPHLVIYTALRALRLGVPEWWDRFDTGDNLLFRKDDFLNPQESPLLKGLWRHAHPELVALAGHLVIAARGRQATVPWLDELVKGDRVQPLGAADFPTATVALGQPGPGAGAAAVPPPPMTTPWADLDSDYGDDGGDAVQVPSSYRRQREKKSSGMLVPLLGGAALLLTGVVVALVMTLSSGSKTEEQPPPKDPPEIVEQAPSDGPGAVDPPPDNGGDPVVADPPAGELKSLEVASGVRRAFYSGTGRFLVCECDDGHVRVLNAASGEELYKLGSEVLPAVGGEGAVPMTVAPVELPTVDHLALSTPSIKAVLIWDLAGRRAVAKVPVTIQGQADILRLSGDGRIALIVVKGNYNAVDLGTGATVGSGTVNASNRAVEIDATGTLFATVPPRRPRQVILRDVRVGTAVRTLSSGSELVRQFCFSPDGDRLLGFGDVAYQVWDTATGELLVKQNLPEPADSVSVCPGGRHVVVTGKQAVALLEINSGEVIATAACSGPAVNSDVSPHGDAAVFCSAEAPAVWELPEATHFEPPTPPDSSGTGSAVVLKSDRLRSAQISADGRFVIGLTQNWFIMVFDSLTGEPLYTVQEELNVGMPKEPGDNADFRGLGVHPTENWVFFRFTEQPFIGVWDLDERVVARTIEVPAFASGLWNGMTLSSNGHFLCAKRGGNWYVVDTRTKTWLPEVTQSIATGQNQFPEPSPLDGSLLLAGPDDKVRLFKPGSAEPREFTGHAGGVTGAKYLPEGTRFISLSDDGTMRLWDVATGDALATTKLDGEPILAEAMPDGFRAMVSFKDGTVRVYDVESGKVEHTFGDAPADSRRATVSPKGDVVVTFGPHPQRLWDLPEFGPRQAAPPDPASPEPVVVANHSLTATDIGYSPDGKAVAASVSGKVHLYSAEDGELLRTLKHDTFYPPKFAFLDGGKVVTYFPKAKEFTVWDWTTGKEDTRIAVPNDATAGYEFLAGRPGHAGFAACGSDGRVDCYDVEAVVPVQTIRVTESPANAVEAIFTPDGKWLITFRTAVAPRLWDVGTGESVREFTDGGKAFLDVAVSPDGSRLLGVATEGVVVWSLDDAKVTGRIDQPKSDNQKWHRGRFLDGAGVVALIDLVGHVSIVNCDDGSKQKSFGVRGGPQAPLFAVSPTGAGVAASYPVGRQKQLVLWDLTGSKAPAVVEAPVEPARPLGPPKKVYTLTGPTSEVLDVAISREGNLIAAIRADKRVYLYDAGTGTPTKTIDLSTKPFDIVGVRFRKENELMLIARQGLVFLLDVAAEKTLVNVPVTIRGPSAKRARFAVGDLSADGEEVIVGGPFCPACLVSLRLQKLVETMGEKTATAVALSRTRRWILTGNLGPEVYLQDRTGKVLRTFNGGANTLRRLEFSPDEKLAAAMFGDVIHVWDIATEKSVATFRDPGNSGNAGFQDFAFHPTRKAIVSFGTYSGLQVWDVETGKAVASERQPMPIGEVARELALTTDGSRAVLGSDRGGLVIWEFPEQ